MGKLADARIRRSGRWPGVCIAVAIALACGVQVAQAQSEPATPVAPNATSGPTAPDVEDLGGGRYRIGEISLDRNARWFEMPGRMISQDAIDAPIEFLAVVKGGMKGYEAVLELDTTAVAFNTACILLGLDVANATLPKYHFDPDPVKGDVVNLEIRWEDNGKRVVRPLADLILADGAPVTSDWVYVGSAFDPDGRYLAEMFGTLIGVVHDPDSIIQHRTGLGLGDYGAVTVNPEAGLTADLKVVVRVSVGDAGRR